MFNGTTQFNEILWQYYADHGRHDLPWRLPASDGQFDAYKILISEVMLQQTQVSRVIPKYHEFLMKFPNRQRLAAAPLSEVLVAWSGLGYNRRAKYLWQAVQAGTLPDTEAGLTALPGIGKNTAGAVLAYAYNQPVIFIETNIRTVYIHHFFSDQSEVPDKAIAEVLAETLDRERPREFYWALMDYGTHLKRSVGNVSKFSKSYTKQSKFEGSRRQLRGQVLRLLAARPRTATELQAALPDERLAGVIADLVHEKLIKKTGDQLCLFH